MHDEIMKLIEKNEIDSVVVLFMKMKKTQYKEMCNWLVEEMKATDDCCIRNTIAIILGDLRYNGAVDALIQLIQNPQNANSRGTLIYALKELKCEKNLTDLIDILLNGNFETKWNMHDLILKKRKLLSKKDRKKYKKEIKKKIIALEIELGLYYDLKEKL